MDKRELEITAELADIELSDSDIGRFTQAVEQMIQHFEVMAGVDVDDNVSDARPVGHALREDRAHKSVMNDAIIDQSPEHEDRYIIIPNVL